MKLIKLTVTAFKKISPDAPVVIAWDDNDSKVAKAIADQEKGKTSLHEALLVAIGHLPRDEDFINRQSGKLEVGLEFEGKDRRKYTVRVTKSKLVLDYEGESLPAPIEKLKELLGVPLVSPMSIKFRPLNEIVKWLAAYTTKGAEEFEKKMIKYKQTIKEAKAGRASANKSLKGLNEYLNSQELFLDWEESEKEYKTKIDQKAMSAKLDEVSKRSDTFLQTESRAKQLVERRKAIADEIKKLQSEDALIVPTLEKHQKFVADNKNVSKEYDEVRKEYDTIAKKAIAYERWQDIKRKKKEADEFETLSQQFDQKEKDVLEKIKELQAEIIPDVKDVELVLEDEIEDGEVIRKEGFYHKGINAAQQSESEWTGVVFRMIKKSKPKVMVIDNVKSLGSGAMSIIDGLIKDGCYALLGEMERGKQTLEIQYE